MCGLYEASLQLGIKGDQAEDFFCRFELEAKAKGIADPYHEDWCEQRIGAWCMQPVQPLSRPDQVQAANMLSTAADVIWWKCRLDAPFGTEDKPVQVTSAYEERIVGVPDPNDDSIVWWGTVHEGQPPKQILEGGEFFVLKRVPDTDAHSH